MYNSSSSSNWNTRSIVSIAAGIISELPVHVNNSVISNNSNENYIKAVIIPVKINTQAMYIIMSFYWFLLQIHIITSITRSSINQHVTAMTSARIRMHEINVSRYFLMMAPLIL